MNNKAAQAYIQTKVGTTDQGQLLLLLYDGALRFLQQAREKMLAKDYAGKGVYISKALDIIGELSSSLNMEKGGELATNLNNLSEYLISNFCNPLSLNDVARDLNLSSVATTQKYMDYLSEPYLFFYLPRFNNKLKLMKKAPQKIYVVDNGFVTAKAFSLSENLGRLLENQVFIELLRRGYDTQTSLFYYRSRNDREVDFVIRKGTRIEALIQVCYDMTASRTEKREVDSLVECGGELKCDNLMIVTEKEERIIKKDGYRIKVVPVRLFSKRA